MTAQWSRGLAAPWSVTKAILIGCGDIANRSCRYVVEDGTPEGFFKSPTNERTKSFLSKIL